MTNAFAAVYPSTRSVPGRIFRPVTDPWTYARAFHLALLFPRGLAYFVFFVTAFAFGGSLVWTFIGPAVLLAAMWVSLRIGDGEAWLVGQVTGIEIRRPPQRLEGVTSFRQRLWARAIDPTTWTGLVYEILQFPIGVGAFVAMVAMFSVAGALIGAPLIIWAAGEPIQIFSDGDSAWLTLDQPYEALPITLLGMLAWLITMHVVLVMSALHSMWARLMLGSKSRRRPASLEPERPGPSPGHSSTGSGWQPAGPGWQLSRPEPSPELYEPPKVVALPPPEPAAVRKAPSPEEEETEFPPAMAELTPREREVTLLLARGMSNADIAETCYISEGTVKTHVKRILSKLDLHDRTQVVVFAYERGLVRPGGMAAEAAAVRSAQP